MVWEEAYIYIFLEGGGKGPEEKIRSEIRQEAGEKQIPRGLFF